MEDIVEKSKEVSSVRSMAPMRVTIGEDWCEESGDCSIYGDEGPE